MGWDSDDFDALTNDNNNIKLASTGTISYIESLLKTSLLEDEDKNYDLESLTEEEAQELIEYLHANQVDRIEAGLAYGQKDILRKLKNFE